MEGAITDMEGAITDLEGTINEMKGTCRQTLEVGSTVCLSKRHTVGNNEGQDNEGHIIYYVINMHSMLPTCISSHMSEAEDGTI